MARLLTDRYHDRLAGVLSCYDRIVIPGTLLGACYAEGMTRILKARGIRVFDYPTQFAAPLRDRVREAAARLAAAAALRSSTSPRAISVRRTWSPRFWRRAARIRAWCM